METSLQPELSLPPLNHLAIIMDGNGRWAEKRGLARSKGHSAGTRAVRPIINACVGYKIPHLTLYTFSTENWKRPVTEINFLFGLLCDYIHEELPNLTKNDVRLHILGDMSALPLPTRKALDLALDKTKNCSTMTLHLALNYSSRDEIARACRLCVENNIPAESITIETVQQFLYTANMPDPDLIIRTSGEYRLSNFLLFQSAYSELYFTDIYWPDFTPQDLHKALSSYAARSRRFGNVTV